MDMKYGHEAWTCGIVMRHGHAAMDMQDGLAAWTYSMDMRHEHAARICCMDMQQGHAGMKM
jgi:hypothetical protein